MNDHRQSLADFEMEPGGSSSAPKPSWPANGADSKWSTTCLWLMVFTDGWLLLIIWSCSPFRANTGRLARHRQDAVACTPPQRGVPGQVHVPPPQGRFAPWRRRRGVVPVQLDDTLSALQVVGRVLKQGSRSQASRARRGSRARVEQRRRTRDK